MYPALGGWYVHVARTVSCAADAEEQQEETYVVSAAGVEAPHAGVSVTEARDGRGMLKVVRVYLREG